MCNAVDSSPYSHPPTIGARALAWAGANHGSARHSTRARIGYRPALAALMLIAGPLLPAPPCAAQQLIGLALKAGETYVFKGLDGGTPQVRFSDNPHRTALCWNVADQANAL